MKKYVTKYDVVADETLLDLIRKVNEKIAEGWQPQGGLLFSDNSKRFAQAMVLVQEKE